MDTPKKTAEEQKRVSTTTDVEEKISLECYVKPALIEEEKKPEEYAKPDCEGEENQRKEKGNREDTELRRHLASSLKVGGASCATDPVKDLESTSESYASEKANPSDSCTITDFFMSEYEAFMSQEATVNYESSKHVLPVLEHLIEKEQENVFETEIDDVEETCSLQEFLYMYDTRKKRRNVPFGLQPQKKKLEPAAFPSDKLSIPSEVPLMKDDSKEHPSMHSPLEESTSSVPAPLKILEFEEFYRSMESKHKVHIGYHKVVIKTFHPEYPEIYIRIPRNCLISEVKQRVKDSLGLKSDSTVMFGLFEGKLGSPVRHIADDLPVQHFAVLSFQRFSFDKNLEVDVTERDTCALQLIYYEIQYMLENEKLISREPNLKNILMATTSTSPEAALELFVQRMRLYKRCYWSQYYHACFCTINSPFEMEKIKLHANECVHLIGLNMENIVLFDDNEILCIIQWNDVQLVKQNPEKRLVKFNVWVGCQIATLAMQSKQHDYIFSIAIHIIKLHEAMSSVRSSFRSGPELIRDYLVFWNDSFYWLGADTRLTRAECKLRATKLEASGDFDDQQNSSDSEDENFVVFQQKSKHQTPLLEHSCCEFPKAEDMAGGISPSRDVKIPDLMDQAATSDQMAGNVIESENIPQPDSYEKRS